MGWTASGYLNITASGYPGWTASGYEVTSPAPPVTSVTIIRGAITPQDIIKDALKRLTAYQSSDQLAQPDAQDGLTTLNDLLDSWSTKHWCVFGSVENILSYIGGQYQYTIGNPDGGTFLGDLAQGSATISNINPLPANLVVNGDLEAFSSLIPTGTYITAIGTNSLTMSNPSLGNASQDQVDYTVPGDFKCARPLRITNAFTRITTGGAGGYDYPIDIISQDRYVEYGLKSIPYPWPTALWYNNTYPYGTISFYGQPVGGGELHLFTDTILGNLTLNQAISVPQGYLRALKWNLARELALAYGFPEMPQLAKLAKESLQAIKDLNAVPVPESHSGLPRFSGGHTDAGGILYGFYRR